MGDRTRRLDRQGQPITRDEWMRLFEDLTYRQVARTELPDGSFVSTVWLGFDHGFGGPVPILFEAMDFPANEFQERYATESEAIAGHRAIVAAVLAKKNASDIIEGRIPSERCCGNYHEDYEASPKATIRKLLDHGCRWEECVEAVLNPAEVLLYDGQSDYQGRARVFVRNQDGYFVIYEWSWGSCSGCDGWEGVAMEKVHGEIRHNAQAMTAEQAADFLIGQKNAQDKLSDDEYSFGPPAKWVTVEMIAKVAEAARR